MKRLRFFTVITFLSVLLATFFAPIAYADTATEVMAATGVEKPEYHRGTITDIVGERKIEDGDQNYYTQNLRVRLEDSGELVEVIAGSEFMPLNERQRLKVGTQVILGYQEVQPGQKEYVLADVYRLPVLVWLGIGFFALVIFIARKQGFLSIVGMALSLFVLTYQIVPQILAGQNPILVSMIGCTIVATLTVYLCHGISRESHIALVSMFLTLFAVSLLSYISVQLAHLVGLGTEEAYYLQFGPSAKLNLQGLLLGGIMLGTLGVLDDITIAQVSVVTQLKQAKPNIDFGELYNRSLAVGKDHVASLVNTLVLAYAGSSLPLFLLFTLSQTQPVWVALNSEMIAEEIVRTLIGSIGLVLAVPLTTIAASYFAINFPQAEGKGSRNPHAGHHH